MKIIFLDIDGVLNSVEQSIANRLDQSDVRLYRIDPVRVGLLRWLVDQTDAKIVISSTWRYGHTLQWFEGYFEALGWLAPVIGLTPKLDKIRGLEVQAWLDADDEMVGDVEKYVILDDDSDFLDGQPLVHCSSVCGLSLKEVIAAVDILGVGVSGDQKEVEDLRKYC